MHIHLDVIGGIAGDMFVAAMLDCFPEFAADLDDLMLKAGFRDLVTLEREPANDGIMAATRFKVHAAENASGHEHRHYGDIKKIIGASRLDDETKDHALGMFRLLAEAEAKVHGTDVESVGFHEVGAWDSIADVVCAAWLIHKSRASSWSVSKLPVGRGRVMTAHGPLPVPPPATALLLGGFEFFDDGLDGERITPTGAAILKYLAPASGLPDAALKLDRSGVGMGTKRFEGISNVLRLLTFKEPEAAVWHGDRVLQVEFEIDDQSPEDLAVGLERIRRLDGVLDVIQMPGFGKKGRQLTAIRILARPDAEPVVLRRCFDETTTLGVRRQLVSRAILDREETTVEDGDASYRVKIARRPAGASAKPEIEDLENIEDGQRGRQGARKRVERAALDREDDD